jgi:hypothetical protein
MKKVISFIASALFAMSLHAANYYEGVVKDVVHGGGYTYLQIEGADQKPYWIAVEGVQIAKGMEVRFKEEMRAQNFHSNALNRTFDEVMFASGLQHRTNVSAQGNLAFITEHVAASPYQQKGTLSIQEAWEKRAELNGKTVTVRAKVVKASENILKRNWIHLQDGTGENNEVGRIVFTSKELPKVGDIVSAKGVVAIDKDFGSGYIYKMIVEDARFSK